MSFLKMIGADDDETGGAFKASLVKQISSSKSITLPADVLNLVLTGKANINGTGNALDNTITGNVGANELDGGWGDDRLFGEGGNDELSGWVGNDELFGGSGDDELSGWEGDDQLSGGDGDDRLSGWDGHDVLDGGAGQDHLRGGLGNDRLVGGAGNDTLFANEGDDRLDGGSGDDIMYGGKGSDTYVVNSALDQVRELSLSTDAADIDSVFASVNYTLDYALENLTLTGKAKLDGTGNASVNVLTGNAAANVIKGLAGDDVLIGGAGADTLVGGAGADRFVFKALSDSPGKGGHDMIGTRSAGEGFAHGDLIDLSAIDANTKVAGNQSFSLVKAFGGHAGELQVTKLASTSLLVSADVNGDAKADFAVQVNGVSQLHAGDFVL